MDLVVSAVFSRDANPLEFWSEDQRFGLRIDGDSMQAVLRHCINARKYETGGVLIGHYSDNLDCALVSAITGPDEDSKTGKWWFERGTGSLRRILLQYWRSGKGYYLGEWHFHPFASPAPSVTDTSTMMRIAANPAYQCKQPLLLIIGGDPSAEWTASVHVYPQGKGALKLSLIKREDS